MVSAICCRGYEVSPVVVTTLRSCWRGCRWSFLLPIHARGLAVFMTWFFQVLYCWELWRIQLLLDVLLSLAEFLQAFLEMFTPLTGTRISCVDHMTFPSDVFWICVESCWGLPCVMCVMFHGRWAAATGDVLLHQGCLWCQWYTCA